MQEERIMTVEEICVPVSSSVVSLDYEKKEKKALESKKAEPSKIG